MNKSKLKKGTFSAEETQKIINVWPSLKTAEDKKLFAKSLNRKYISVYNKACDLKLIGKKPITKKIITTPTIVQKPAKINVAVLYINGVKIEIPSRDFKVEGKRIQY